MALGLADVGGALLLVSQFTLYGDVRKGRRPSFDDAMPPEVAALYADARATDPQAAARVERLTKLKRRLESGLPSRVRHYSVQWDAERQRVIGL